MIIGKLKRDAQRVGHDARFGQRKIIALLEIRVAPFFVFINPNSQLLSGFLQALGKIGKIETR